MYLYVTCVELAWEEPFDCSGEWPAEPEPLYDAPQDCPCSTCPEGMESLHQGLQPDTWWNTGYGPGTYYIRLLACGGGHCSAAVYDDTPPTHWTGCELVAPWEDCTVSISTELWITKFADSNNWLQICRLLD